MFVATFLAVAVWETHRPSRELRFPTGKRWGTHAILYLLSGLVGRLALSSGPIAVALTASNRPWGLLNSPSMPWGLSVLLTILLLDFGRYVLHLAHHRIGFLWRFHQVHHSDPDFDLTTGVRGQPLEWAFVRFANLAAVFLLAPPVGAVFIYELLSIIHTFFSHANADMPDRLDTILLRFTFTPNVHRVHHSIDVAEQNHNLGEIFTFWDRAFGTYQARSCAGKMFAVGLKEKQDQAGTLTSMLLEPLALQRAGESQNNKPKAGGKQHLDSGFD